MMDETSLNLIKDNQTPLDESHQEQFQRWYDEDLFVGALVYAMQGMSYNSQHLFARLVQILTDETVTQMGRDQFLKDLNWNRVANLRKSKRKRRWYDQEPKLFKAFNKLYALNEELRQDVAHKLFIPCQLVHKYELFCEQEQKEPDPIIIRQIVETCVKRGPEKAIHLYGVYLDYFKE